MAQVKLGSKRVTFKETTQKRENFGENGSSSSTSLQRFNGGVGSFHIKK